MWCITEWDLIYLFFIYLYRKKYVKTCFPPPQTRLLCVGKEKQIYRGPRHTKKQQVRNNASRYNGVYSVTCDADARANVTRRDATMKYGPWIVLHKRKHISFLLHARPDSVRKLRVSGRESPNLIAIGIYTIASARHRRDVVLAKRERKRHCDCFHSALNFCFDRFRFIDGSFLLFALSFAPSINAPMCNNYTITNSSSHNNFNFNWNKNLQLIYIFMYIFNLNCGGKTFILSQCAHIVIIESN